MTDKPQRLDKDHTYIGRQQVYCKSKDEVGIPKHQQGFWYECSSCKKSIFLREADRYRNPPKDVPQRLDKDHTYIGGGLVYCRAEHDSAKPKPVAGRLFQCSLCYKRIFVATSNPFVTLRYKTRSARAFRMPTTGRFGSSRKKNPPMYELSQAIWNLIKSGHELSTIIKIMSPSMHGAAQKWALRKIAAKLMGVFRKRTELTPSVSANPPRLNPARQGEMPLIYGKTESITMQKTKGPYKGQHFKHDFKIKPEQHGIPRGSILTLPDGKQFTITTRSVLLTGKKDLWRKFPA